jgi:hypothetical protein
MAFQRAAFVRNFKKKKKIQTQGSSNAALCSTVLRAFLKHLLAYLEEIPAVRGNFPNHFPHFSAGRRDWENNNKWKSLHRSRLTSV